MHVFAKAAGLGAINLTLLWKKGASQQRGLTLSTGKAGLCGMPVLPVIGHLCVVHTCFKRDRKTLRCWGKVCIGGDLWVIGILWALFQDNISLCGSSQCEPRVALSFTPPALVSEYWDYKCTPHIWFGVVLVLSGVGYIQC